MPAGIVKFIIGPSGLWVTTAILIATALMLYLKKLSPAHIRQVKIIASLKREKEFYQRFATGIVSSLSYKTEDVKPQDQINKAIQAAVDMLGGGAGLFIEREKEADTFPIKSTCNLPQDVRVSPTNYPELDKLNIVSKPELLFENLPGDTIFSHAFIMPLKFLDDYFGIVVILAQKLDQQQAHAYLRTLAALVSVCAMSISNLRLLGKITDQAQETVSLNNISLTLNTFQNLNDLLTSFMEETNNFMGTDAAAIHLWNEETGKLSLKLSIGFSVAPEILRDVCLEEGIVGWVAKNQQVLEIPNLKESPYRDECGSAFNYLLIIPIISRSRLIGVISYMSSAINNISDKNISSLLSMINSVAINIENVELYEKTKTLARYDSLTGLLNHRELHFVLDKELERAKRYDHNLTLVMIDIDYFKNYNDNNGHAEGDLTLETIGKIITDCIRHLDFAFRYGGEEFSILILETEKNAAYKVAERIRRRFEKTNFSGQKKQPNGNLTISLGIATFPSDADNKKELINRADQALYQAKNLGRNQTQLYKGNEAA